MTQVELVYFVATTVYETENCGGDNITPGEDVSRTNSDFGVRVGGGGGVVCIGVRQTLMCQGPPASLIRPWSSEVVRSPSTLSNANLVLKG